METTPQIRQYLRPYPLPEQAMIRILFICRLLCLFSLAGLTAACGGGAEGESSSSSSPEARSSQSSLVVSSDQSSSTSLSSRSSSSISSSAPSQTVTVEWSHPNERENGAYLELSEIGGYEIRVYDPEPPTLPITISKAIPQLVIV